MADIFVFYQLCPETLFLALLSPFLALLLHMIEPPCGPFLTPFCPFVLSNQWFCCTIRSFTYQNGHKSYNMQGNKSGVNKNPNVCQNPSRQELNLDRRFSTFSHLTEIQMTDCRETVLGSKELKTVYHWTFLSSPDSPQKTDLMIAETHYRLFWLFICR